MLRFHIPVSTDFSVFRRLYFGMDFLPALCNVFSSLAILSASEIMEASRDDSKTFHKLLRMQRSNSAINTDTLVIVNVEYNQSNIMEAWRIHFENLATPSLDENKFDLERNSLCTIQNDIIAEVTANKVKIPPATEAEVKQAKAE
jgi:thioester reductase-like protein